MNLKNKHIILRFFLEKIMAYKGLEKFNELVESFANLPTIGKKTAIRLALYICMQNPLEGMKLSHNIENALRFIKSCRQCGALSENELCEICTDTQRDENLICLVENAKDILILEESGGYNGFYFVLNELNEEKLKSKELIFALTHSVHSDATIFFIEENLKNLELKLSKIAQGIPSGVNLENVDFISLHRAINFRTKIH